MNHDEIRERVLALVDGELGRSEAESVEGHLAGCAECRALRADLERTGAFLEYSLSSLAGGSRKAEILAGVSAGAVDPILDPLPARSPRCGVPHDGKRRSRAPWIGLAASLAAALLVGLGYFVYVETVLSGEVALEVAGTPRFVPGGRGKVLVRTVRNLDGAPAAGRRVEATLSTREVQRIALGTFETGEDGTVLAEFAIPEGVPRHATLRFRDEASGRERAFDVTFADPVRIALATDRPIYRPGETLRVRALLARAADGVPIEDAAVRIEIADGEDRIVSREEHASSRYGLVWTDLPLDPEAEPGVYEIRVTSQDSTATARVAVRRYEKPMIDVDARVEAEDGKGYLLAGDRANLVVVARYYFGRPVEDARIRVDGVAREVRGEDGRYEIPFALPREVGRFAFEGDVATRTTTVEVADPAGHRALVEVAYAVARHEIRVEVVPAGGERLTNHPEEVYVRVTDPSGKPIEGTLVHRGREVALSSGYGRMTIDVGAGDLYHALEVRAAGGRSRKLVDWLEAAAADPRPVHVVVRNPYVAAGEALDLEVHAGAGGPPAIDVHFVSGGIVAGARPVELAGDSTRVAVEVPEGATGLAEIVWSLPAVGPVGKRAIWIADRDPLRVEAVVSVASEGAGYLPVGMGQVAPPGAPARLDVRVTDAEGEPVTGALSLGAVDAKVFDVAGIPLERGPRLVPDRPGLPAGLEGEARQIATGMWLARRLATSDAAGPGFVSSRDADGGRVHSRERLARFVGGYLAAVLVLFGCLWFVIVRLAGCARPAAALLALAALGPLAAPAGCGGSDSASPRERAATDADPAERAAKTVPYAATSKPQPERSDSKDEGETAPDEPPARTRFPETLVWEPQILVAGGEASLEFDLADSMTTWRIDGWAVDGLGRSAEWAGEVAVGSDFFAEFEPPARLTRGDEVEFPVTVFNFTGADAEVEVAASGEGFEFAGDPVRRIHAGRGATRVEFRLIARRLGDVPLRVRVAGAGRADTLERAIRVEAEGRAVETVVNRIVAGGETFEVVVPAEAIPDTLRVVANVTTGTRGQVVEGLEGLLRLPGGCFEQTVSITWPNALVLVALERSGRIDEGLRALAIDRTRRGYQRMLAFQNADGGFGLYPRRPSEPYLTALGLAALIDLERALGWVDRRVVERARTHLYASQAGDGSWRDDARLTAYVVWALAGDPGSVGLLRPALRYLQERGLGARSYELALFATALRSAGESGADAALDHLVRQSVAGPGPTRYWPGEGGTLLGAWGGAAAIETTALAAIALDGRPEAGEARAWLLERRGTGGLWHSTQATILALKALLPAFAGGSRLERPVDVVFTDPAGSRIARATIQPGREEVVEVVPLGGARRFGVETGGPSVAVQVVVRYHVRDGGREAAGLALESTYDETSVRVGSLVRGRTTLDNRTGRVTSAVMVRLPVPPGFAADPASVEALRKVAARVDAAPGALLVYLDPLGAGERRALSYSLRAVRRGRVAAGPVEAWQYYEPSSRVEAGEATLVVR